MHEITVTLSDEKFDKCRSWRYKHTDYGMVKVPTGFENYELRASKSLTYYSTLEVAKRLGIDISDVRVLIHTDKIGYIRYRKRFYFIPALEFDKYMEKKNNGS